MKYKNVNSEIKKENCWRVCCPLETCQNSCSNGSFFVQNTFSMCIYSKNQMFAAKVKRILFLANVCNVFLLKTTRFICLVYYHLVECNDDITFFECFCYHKTQFAFGGVYAK